VTTWLVSNPQIGRGYGSRLMDDDQVQDYLAEYFATADRITDGTELVIRKADYMRRVPSFDYAEIEERIARAQSSPNPCAHPAFDVIYGTVTGRIPRQFPLI